MTANENRAAGASFERLFERQCQLAGLWADQNHIKARRAWKGRLQALPSNLDYTVIDRQGRIGFFDCKNFDADHFVYSDLDQHQIDLAERYNSHLVPAGFVVLLRPLDRVYFFAGEAVRRLGPGTRFTPSMGVELGSWSDFDPRTLLHRVPSSGMVP